MRHIDNSSVIGTFASSKLMDVVNLRITCVHD